MCIRDRPFGFALFYLRSVAARTDYKDRITGEVIPAVTTAQIYKGSIAFIVLQLIMVAAVVAFPSLVAGGLESKGPAIDADKAFEQLQADDLKTEQGAGPGASAPGGGAEEDPMKGLLDAVKEEKK